MIAETKNKTKQKKRLCDRPSAQDVPGRKILNLSGGLITSFVLKRSGKKRGWDFFLNNNTILHTRQYNYKHHICHHRWPIKRINVLVKFYVSDE